MTSSRLEIEIKYDAPPDAMVPDLAVLDPVESVELSAPHVLEATYFDTGDLRLIGAGFSVRRRTGGDDEGWHLKIPMPEGDGRHEVRVSLSRAKARVPKELRDRVVALVGDQELGPIATIRTERTAYRLIGADGGVLAELADDQVTASAGADETTWREWELELYDADAGLLEAAGKVLVDAGARPSDAAAKLVRALGDRLSSPPVPRAGKGAPVALVVQSRLTEQSRRLRQCDPAVRERLPEAVHDMRVATRRLRNALATYRPFLDRASTDPIRDELGWLADTLGEARDAEVLAARIGMLADAQSGEPTAVDADWVRRRLGRRHDAAYSRLVAALRGERYLALLARLEVLTEAPQWTAKAEKPVRTRMPRRLGHDWKRLAHRMAAAEAIGDPSDRSGEQSGRSGERAAALHAARKAVKRVRYAAEPLVPLYGSGAEEFVAALKDLQTRLGDHHDSEAARVELRRLAGETQDRGKALGLGVLHERERLEAVELEAAAIAAWRAASRKKLRTWVG